MQYPVGAVVNFNNKRLVRVALSQITREDPSVLLPNRLHILKHGFNALSEIINDPYWRGDPVTLERSGGKLKIIDGRHRVNLAFEEGFDAVWALVK